jgi:hypothetical protein
LRWRRHSVHTVKALRTWDPRKSTSHRKDTDRADDIGIGALRIVARSVKEDAAPAE